MEVPEIDRELYALHVASMGPRHFSRGSPHEAVSLHNHPNSFNGATAFQPWKLNPVQFDKLDKFTLQWGHGISAVEVIAISSMMTGAFSLQWGHGISAVEVGASALGIYTIALALQWGHGISAVEVVYAGRVPSGVPVASMGPRHFSRGSKLSIDKDQKQRAASMGPRHFSRGSPVWSIDIGAGRRRFNGATAFQPWKLPA